MLSLPFIRENDAIVRRAIADKGVALDLDALLALDGAVRGLKASVSLLRAALEVTCLERGTGARHTSGPSNRRRAITSSEKKGLLHPMRRCQPRRRTTRAVRHDM